MTQPRAVKSHFARSRQFETLSGRRFILQFGHGILVFSIKSAQFENLACRLLPVGIGFSLWSGQPLAGSHRTCRLASTMETKKQVTSFASKPDSEKPLGEKILAKQRVLRKGWTTGACAAAAAKAALLGLRTGKFPDRVDIPLSETRRAEFSIAETLKESDSCARAGVIKDAGDDPDVTHGALIRTRICLTKPGTGLCFAAGEGVGVITLPGLPLPPGEPAINPVPRLQIREALAEACNGAPLPDCQIEVSIPNGEKLAQKTWNPRLGIIGGLSILGTTGIVTPYSCSAWIHSIHRGIDVARARKLVRIGAATGKTSERALRVHAGLETESIIDMGDFIGGMIKYLRRNPVPQLVLCGGLAKITKFAQGALDLRASQSQLDFAKLALMLDCPAELRAQISNARTMLELQQTLPVSLEFERRIAQCARARMRQLLPKMRHSILVVNRNGAICACIPRRKNAE